MKKLFLSLALLLGGSLATGDALARHCRRNRCCPTRCPKRCEKKRVSECVTGCVKFAEEPACEPEKRECKTWYTTRPCLIPRVVYDKGECVNEWQEECVTNQVNKCISGCQPRGSAAAKYGAENVIEYSDSEADALYNEI